MIKKTDIVYNEHNQLLDVFIPDNGDIKAVFVFFHGGGIEVGSKVESNNFVSYLTDRGIAVVSANYRMYPESHFPDFLEDAADAVAWVYKNKSEFQGCEKIFVGGSSAGGYISMMLCFDKRYLEKNNIKPTDISGYIHDSGQPTSHFNVLKYSGVDPRRVIIDDRAPLYFVGIDKCYSPMIFIVADNDMKNRYEQTMLMLSALKTFEYDESLIKFKLMHGKHCEHCKAKDENGDSVFGKVIYNFISEFV